MTVIMRRLLALAVCLFSFLSTTLARSSTGNSVLVVLENDLAKEDYSVFFSGLEERGYELSFRDPKGKKHPVIEDDVPLYDHLILFTPTTKSYSSDITPQNLVDLLSKNVNIIFVLSPSQTPLTSLAAEFSLIPAPPNTPLLSHFPKRDPPYTTIPISVPSSHQILTQNLQPVLFSGTPHAYNPSPLLVPILHAPPESFAADSDSDSGADALVDAAERGGEGLWAGSQLGLVTGFQLARPGHGRALWVGGISVFGDEFARGQAGSGQPTGNKQFAQDIASWAFQETNVLRVDSTSHRLASTSPNNKTATVPESYTVNDMVKYEAHVSKWEPTVGQWVPYSGLGDLQLEFTMLDPHIRTSLLPSSSRPGTYELTFRAPDRHGVFKFVLDYRRKGWSFLYDTITVPVVPPRHDGYPRFLSAAWPYYAGAVSTSVGFILFSALWLGGKDDHQKAKGKKIE